MKKVIYTKTTTDGKTLLYCSTGENTGDMEVIEFPKDVHEKDCDCLMSVELLDPNIDCEKCKARIDEWYKKHFASQ